MRRATRSRRRSGRSGWATLAALAALAGLVGAVALPAASVGYATLPRGAGVDAVGDGAGVQELDTAAAVHVNATDPLTNVTNRFGRAVTVTVTLRDDAEHIGDLVVDGAVVGNATSFSLTAGRTETVSIRIPDDQSLTDEVVYFHVEASGDGLLGRTHDRKVPVNA